MHKYSIKTFSTKEGPKNHNPYWSNQKQLENYFRGLLLTQLLHIKIVNTKNFGCIKDLSRQRKGTMRLLPMEVEDLIKSSRAVGTRGILLKGSDNKTVRR